MSMKMMCEICGKDMDIPYKLMGCKMICEECAEAEEADDETKEESDAP